MLSYRHAFHAGNHADVLKHITQSLIIEALKKKEKAILFLDTHAGAGSYSLKSDQAQKTGEALSGIQSLWLSRAMPTTLGPYLKAIAVLNQNSQLERYPGSPLIASYLLRPQDRLSLSELHPTDFSILRQVCLGDRRIRVDQVDGYQQIKAKLPPLSRRGFIFIDPPYEVKSDYQMVAEVVQEGLRRFACGVYCLWYPVVERLQSEALIRKLKKIDPKTPMLRLELEVAEDRSLRGMTASGLVVVNPPWGLEQQMAQILPWLKKELCPTGRYQMRWLVE